MSVNLIYSTKPLIDALDEFDRTALNRKMLWDNAESNEDILAAEKADKDALSKVQDAFYEATKDRNSRLDCSRVDIDFARAIAEIEVSATESVTKPYVHHRLR